MVSMEADIAAGIAMFVLARFTGTSPVYTETFSVDYGENALLIGHAGYHDPAQADPNLPVRVVPDVEYMNSDPFTGCATYFKYRSGPVTVINSVWNNGKLKWVAFEGESVGDDYKMEGNTHLFCKLDVDVKEFLSVSIASGVSQHWIVVPDRILNDIGRLCDVLNITWLPIEPN